MTKAQALQTFFSSFGLPAYVSTSVPDEQRAGNYIVWQFIDGGFGTGTVVPTVQIRYKTDSEAIPNAKAKALYDAIGEGKLLKYDDGYILLNHGRPWCIAASGEGDSSIKVRQINVNMTYYSL